MNENRRTAGTFAKGLADGLPICLGYVSVSFAFGLMATENGLPVYTAVLISMTNFTSAGQFAGTALILSGGSLLEIAVTTFVINIRYMLMSLSLSQKLDARISTLARAALAFGNTDEVFAVAMQQPAAVPAAYLSGLILSPYAGWTLGTALGATAAGLLSPAIRSALGIAIYGMFIAIIVPPMRKLRTVAVTVVVSALLSCMLRLAPATRGLSKGWVVILCAVAACTFAALRYPVDAPQGEDV